MYNLPRLYKLCKFAVYDYNYENKSLNVHTHAILIKQ